MTAPYLHATGVARGGAGRGRTPARAPSRRLRPAASRLAVWCTPGPRACVDLCEQFFHVKPAFNVLCTLYCIIAPDPEEPASPRDAHHVGVTDSSLQVRQLSLTKPAYMYSCGSHGLSAPASRPPRQSDYWVSDPNGYYGTTGTASSMAAGFRI